MTQINRRSIDITVYFLDGTAKVLHDWREFKCLTDSEGRNPYTCDITVRGVPNIIRDDGTAQELKDTIFKWIDEGIGKYTREYIIENHEMFNRI